MPEDFPNDFGASCSIYVDLRGEKLSDHKLFASFQKNGETTQFLNGGPSLYTLHACSQPVFTGKALPKTANFPLFSPISMTELAVLQRPVITDHCQGIKYITKIHPFTT